ncbi:MAG: hypothetical protein WBG87_01475 [Stenotrophomonas maltophilia]
MYDATVTALPGARTARGVKVLSAAGNVLTNAPETDVARLRSRVLYVADGLPSVVVNAIPAWHSAVMLRHPHETIDAGESVAAVGPGRDADT